MDFPLGGGGAQSASSSLAVAAASAAARTSTPLSQQVSALPSDLPASIYSSATATASAAAATAAASSSRLIAESASATTASFDQATSSAILVNPAHFNGHDNGPILYTDSNRTSAIDDIRNIIICICFATILFCFLLILLGIRNEKLPTFFCIGPSILVSFIIIISFFGTTWHVGEAPISAAYKAFSRDRIQGDLSVRIGLQSVNISLKAHKYYILHHTDGPIIMENMPPTTMLSSMTSSSSSSLKRTNSGTQSIPDESTTTTNGQQSSSGAAASFIEKAENSNRPTLTSNSLADELSRGRSLDGIPVDTELESDEVFSSADLDEDQTPSGRATRSSSRPARNKRQHQTAEFKNQTTGEERGDLKPKYTIKRVHVDINYNERFYWIGPVQMRHEYHQALERGLPYPILTVVEYLSQDDAGFNWSRRYRAAGYYTSMCLWLSASLCFLMICLHCAAPKYGIYAMQLLGCLLLFTNLTYATLVPKGDHKLVIPFEGQSLSFRFGANFWLVLIGGCLSLLVGTIIVILDNIFPNFIVTNVLDADFDTQQNYYQRKHKTILYNSRDIDETDATKLSNGDNNVKHQKPKLPPFMRKKAAISLRALESQQNNINNNKLNNGSDAEVSETVIEERTMNREDEKQIVEDDDKFYDKVASIRQSYLQTSENKNQHHSRGAEMLRRRPFEHQSINSSQETSSSSDHRNIDSRGTLTRSSPDKVLQ